MTVSAALCTSVLLACEGVAGGVGGASFPQSDET